MRLVGLELFVMTAPETSICWIVGLDGDLTTLTLDDGTHGCAVTKYTSWASAKLCSAVFSAPAPLSPITANASDAGYVRISGAARVTLLVVVVSVAGVEMALSANDAAAFSSVGVPCTELTGANRLRVRSWTRTGAGARR